MDTPSIPPIEIHPMGGDSPQEKIYGGLIRRSDNGQFQQVFRFDLDIPFALVSEAIARSGTSRETQGITFENKETYTGYSLQAIREADTVCEHINEHIRGLLGCRSGIYSFRRPDICFARTFADVLNSKFTVPVEVIDGADHPGIACHMAALFEKAGMKVVNRTDAIPRVREGCEPQDIKTFLDELNDAMRALVTPRRRSLRPQPGSAQL
jgi:hypothetical protein